MVVDVKETIYGANTAMRAGHYTKSTELYRQSFSGNSRLHAEALAGLGTTQAMTAQYHDARSHLEAALSHDPHVLQGHRGLMYLEAALGNFSKAISHADSAIRLADNTIRLADDPDLIAADRGQLLVQTGDFDQARHVLMRLMEKHPTRYRPKVALGFLELINENPDEAYDLFVAAGDRVDWTNGEILSYSALANRLRNDSVEFAEDVQYAREIFDSIAEPAIHERIWRLRVAYLTGEDLEMDYLRRGILESADQVSKHFAQEHQLRPRLGSSNTTFELPELPVLD